MSHPDIPERKMISQATARELLEILANADIWVNLPPQSPMKIKIREAIAKAQAELGEGTET